MRLLLLLAVMALPTWAVDSPTTLLSWSRGLDVLRNPSTKDRSAALLFGGTWTRTAQLIANGTIKTHGVPVIVVQAGDQVINPITNQPVMGVDLFHLFGGNAGSLAFLNDQGLPITYMVLPQIVHDSNPDLLSTYFHYVASKSYAKVTLGEFCRALGLEDVVVASIKRSERDGLGKVLAASTPTIKAVNDVTKELYDPWKHPGYITIYTENPQGAIFIAQVNEILYAFEDLQPRISIVCPYGTRPPLEHILGGDGMLLCNASPDDILAGGATPRIIFTAGDGAQAKGLELKGFQPASVLSSLLNIRMQAEPKALYNDIPLQEADNPFTITPQGQDLILSVFQGKTAKELRTNKP